MNILIDFSQIPVQKMGVGVYALNLIKELKKKGLARYYILVQNDDSSLDEIEDNSINLVRVNACLYRNFFMRALLEQLYIPYLVFKHKINVVHSLHYSFPLLCSAKKVVTVHDMTFFLFPKLHVPVKVLFFRIFIRMTASLADTVICVSEATRKDYLSLFGQALYKSVVIPHGKGQEYDKRIDITKIVALKNKYGISGDYLLFIGTIEPRKNIVNLVKAFSMLLNDSLDIKLVIAGKKGWHYDEVFRIVSESGCINKVIFTGFIDEDEKPILLSCAKVFVYPSFYEGFGIPVLEALACGTPTITSNISSMPEVAGDAALLVNPESPEEIYDAIKKVLLDAHLRSDLKARSLRQASNFSWENTASMTIDVYKGLVKDA